MVKPVAVFLLFPVFCAAMQPGIVNEVDTVRMDLESHILRMQWTIAEGKPLLNKIPVKQVRAVARLCRTCDKSLPNIHEYVATHNTALQEQFAGVLRSLIEDFDTVISVLGADGHMKAVRDIASARYCARTALQTLQAYRAHAQDPEHVPAPIVPRYTRRALVFPD